MPKYGKINLFRKYNLEQGEHALWMESYRQGTIIVNLLNPRSSIVALCCDKLVPNNILRSTDDGGPSYSPSKIPLITGPPHVFASTNLVVRGYFWAHQEESSTSRTSASFFD
jgi:hypothetical protein